MTAAEPNSALKCGGVGEEEDGLVFGGVQGADRLTAYGVLNP